MNEIYNVLLVEDSEDDVFLFSKALRGLPAFRLAGCAGTGEAAIAYLSGEGEFGDRKQYPWPDIVVLDLKMPGSDGFEVLEWLRKQGRRPKVGVFTSSVLEEDPASPRGPPVGAARRQGNHEISPQAGDVCEVSSRMRPKRRHRRTR
jgi:CheY-like chemotaxis protein